MKSYVINLDRSPGRLADIVALFAAHGLSFERIAATDGALPASDTIATLTFARPDYRRLTASEVGCFLSHRAAWRRIADGPDAFATVFEDDILFSRHGTDCLRSADWIPKRAGLVKLEAFDQHVTISRKAITMRANYTISRLWSTHWGSAGYIISRSFAGKMLAATERFSVTVDDALFNPRHCSAKTIVYQIVPALCAQRQFVTAEQLPGEYVSTIATLPGGAELEKPRQAKLKREILRLVKQAANLHRKPVEVRVPFDVATNPV